MPIKKNLKLNKHTVRSGRSFGNQTDRGHACMSDMGDVMGKKAMNASAKCGWGE